MNPTDHTTDCLIIGAGLAGLVTALELLPSGQKIILVERSARERCGGLAKDSFGGINIVDSGLQRLTGIKDSPQLAYRDFCAFGEFGAEDRWPRSWVDFYTLKSRRHIFSWLRKQGVAFFPFVHWVERGLFSPGNSLPRFHMVWGAGGELVRRILLAIMRHPLHDNVTFLFEHDVKELCREDGRVSGCRGETAAGMFHIRAARTVIASGGICGNTRKVEQNWDTSWGPMPPKFLHGIHQYADGRMHDAVGQLGGQITHLNWQWHYAAGVHHPRPTYDNHGLSLVPARSALWLNHRGARIGPLPLVTSFDTRQLVEAVLREKHGYSWQLLNWKIASRELAVSGADYNDDMCQRRPVRFIASILSGSDKLVRRLTTECCDFVVADTLPELVRKMNALNGDDAVDLATVEKETLSWDAMVARPRRFHNDDQLRRIAQVRRYLGDRLRTCSRQPILDPKAGPLVAIRAFILLRKTLGGIQTDLRSRVLDQAGGAPIQGLYAVGECAGFGGGGLNGKRALEGTFLGGCVLTGRAAARDIGWGELLD